MSRVSKENKPVTKEAEVQTDDVVIGARPSVKGQAARVGGGYRKSVVQDAESE
jgi:hypothetical protein